MKEKSIVRVSAQDLERRHGETDWARLRGMLDATVEQDAMRDEDSSPEAFDWSRIKVVTQPQKTPVSLRLDEDVLAWFKAEGRGYQTRINAVLRAYMDAKSG